jgi:hypothetical protein
MPIKMKWHGLTLMPKQSGFTAVLPSLSLSTRKRLHHPFHKSKAPDAPQQGVDWSQPQNTAGSLDHDATN